MEFWKEAKSKRYLLAGRDRTDPLPMLNYKSAPTNFLIVPTAAVLMSPVFSLKIWKASRFALKVIRSRTGVPDASLLFSFAGLFGCLCLAFKSFILFKPSFALKMILEHRTAFITQRLPSWAKGTSWFNQHHNFPIISGQPLFSKYQERVEHQSLFHNDPGVWASLLESERCSNEITVIMSHGMVWDLQRFCFHSQEGWLLKPVKTLGEQGKDGYEQNAWCCKRHGRKLPCWFQGDRHLSSYPGLGKLSSSPVPQISQMWKRNE